MKNSKKITSRRNFALALERGVEVERISVKLEKVVKLWLSRNEIKEVNGKYILA
jgi:hypothetical protein